MSRLLAVLVTVAFCAALLMFFSPLIVVFVAILGAVQFIRAERNNQEPDDTEARRV